LSEERSIHLTKPWSGAETRVDFIWTDKAQSVAGLTPYRLEITRIMFSLAFNAKEVLFVTE
jgi:hypothetical protein